jgi:hypothetical protein
MGNLTSSNDALLDFIGSVNMTQYIGDKLDKRKPSNQGCDPICFAHATATVIQLVLMRIEGRVIPDFEILKQDIVENYYNKSRTQELGVYRWINVFLAEKLKSYGLRHREVDENGARRALNQRRPCVTVFYLRESQMNRLQNYGFVGPRNRTLTRDDFINGISLTGELNGHAVVLIASSSKELTFLNSWGTGWENGGDFQSQTQMSLVTSSTLKFILKIQILQWMREWLCAHEQWIRLIIGSNPLKKSGL